MPEPKIFDRPLNNTSPTLTALSALPILQPCITRSGRILNMSRAGNEEAYLGQERGVPATVPCSHCSQESGPFVGCRVVANMFGGSCCNCHWNGMAARCSFRENVPSPVPLSPLPGPVDLGLSSKTFSEVEQSLNDLLDNPPSTKDRKRYDRWLNVKLTRAVRELMVKYIERTIGRKLVPTSKIKSSVGSICPQFNDPHLPNCFEWHFTAEYPIFPSKRIGEWTFVEVIGCKKALENYDLYPYDLEEEPELPREKRRLLDLARTSFKQHIYDATGDHVEDLQTAFVGNGSVMFPGWKWRYEGDVQDLLEKPLLWKWTAEELRRTLDAIKDGSLKLMPPNQLALSSIPQTPRSTQSSSVDAPRNLSSDIETIIHAHFHGESPSSSRRRLHRRQIIDDDDYDNDEDKDVKSLNYAPANIVPSDLITFTPKAIELIECGKKLPEYIQREKELKNSNAKQQKKIQKLEKDVENIPSHLQKIEELEALRDSQAVKLQEQTESAELAAQMASTKMESVELNNMLLLDQIKKLNKDLEVVKERAASRKAELKKRIQALEKALADEMTSSQTGVPPARTQPLTARRTHTLPPAGSRGEVSRGSKDPTPLNRLSDSMVAGGRTTGNEQRNNNSPGTKQISRTVPDVEFLYVRHAPVGSSWKSVKREASEEASPQNGQKKSRVWQS